MVSESRICLHQNRSEIESCLGVNSTNASRVSSIKDLRMKRVFTPDVNSVSQQGEEKNEERKKLFKGSDASEVLVSDVGCVKVAEDERNNLKHHPTSANGSFLNSKMALNRSCRRKVFKTSSSFSYRRLLPYLMDIVNDASSVSKIEIVDAGIPRRMQKLDGVNSEVRSTAENSYAAKIECPVPQFDDSKPSDNQDPEKVQIKVPFTQPDLNSKENELSQTAEIIRPLEVEIKDHENYMDCVDASAGERIQTTPPDPSVFTKTDVSHGEESVEANKVLAENQTCSGLLVGSEKSSGDALKQRPNSKCVTNSMNRSVLNPCSQLRLFKNPSSLTYRRLLPFLMDISKNNSCSSMKLEHPMPPVVLEEDIHPASATSSGQDYSAEQDCVNKIRTENAHENQHIKNLTQNLLSSVVHLPPDISSPDTNNSPESSMPRSSPASYSLYVEPSSVTSETLPDRGMLIDLQIEEIPQIQSSPTRSELGIEWNESSSAWKPSPIINSDIVAKQHTSEKRGPVGEQKMYLDMGSELHDSNAESIEKVNLKQNSFQVEALDVLVSPNDRPPKGILKRNRRGCRGLCNCLNCASFRLHADKAFEFSRNQMHDAEEVASDLMKELANLRLLLEISIKRDNDSAGVQLDPVLIKQACNKALEAENMAKERLSELNYDLNIHCRIPSLLPPKVSFADNIQERAIPVLDPSSSTEKEG